MYLLHGIGQGLDRFVTLVGKIFAWATLPLMLVIVYDVFTRNVLSHLLGTGLISDTVADTLTVMSSTKLQELEWHLHGVLLLMTFGFAYMREAHVRIELVRDRLRTRTRLWIEAIGLLLFLIPYCLVIIKFGIDFAIRSFDNHEVSAALTGLSHRWIIKSFVALGFLMLLLGGLSRLCRTLVALFGPADLRETAAAFVQDAVEPPPSSPASTSSAH